MSLRLYKKPHRTMLIVAMFTLAVSTELQAQRKIIQGCILDRNTGRPLPGSNIEIVEKGNGTAADALGRFQLTVKGVENITLRVSRIGYKPIEKSIALERDVMSLKIMLESTVVQGESVIVTAMLERPKAIYGESALSHSKLTLREITDQYTTGTLPTVLEQVPGVWTADAGLGNVDVVIRGLRSDGVAYVFNDIPMNNPEDHSVYWSDWTGLVQSTREIEVHRGSDGAGGYGTGLGGTVYFSSMGRETVQQNIFRVSAGVFNRMGIVSGEHAGESYDSYLDEYTDPSSSPVQYTYSGRFSSRPFWNQKMHATFFFEYKRGESYLLGSDFNGFSIGADAQMTLGKHHLYAYIMVAPQHHTEIKALQDIDLLNTLGREYNRRNHPWNENHFTKPMAMIKHQWQPGKTLTLDNTLFVLYGSGAAKYLINDDFDTETGRIGFMPTTRGGDAIAFGKHAQYLYATYGILTTDFTPKTDLSACWFKDMPVPVSLAGENFFLDQHTHSYQSIRRRNYWQSGLISKMHKVLSDKAELSSGIDMRFWQGHRENQVENLMASNTDARGYQVWAPIGENQISQLQAIYDFDTRVMNLSAFLKIHSQLTPRFILEGGAQIAHTRSEVIENPIQVLDFGDWSLMDEALRTTADQQGTRKFSVANDYLRTYTYITPWMGTVYKYSDNGHLFCRGALYRKEPSVLDWYDYAAGPQMQHKYYPEMDSSVDLKPETVISTEVGTGRRLGPMSWNLSAYVMYYHDKIESVVDLHQRHETLNAGEAIFAGIETELYGCWNGFDCKVAASRSRNRWTSLSVNTVFGEEAHRIEGKVVPFAPECMASLSVGRTLLETSGRRFYIGIETAWWDRYFGTYTNTYDTYEQVLSQDGQYYLKSTTRPARLPAYWNVGILLKSHFQGSRFGVTFKLEANKVLNRKENYLGAQYVIDSTRTDELADKYHWYVLQAPLFNAFFTTEISM